MDHGTLALAIPILIFSIPIVAIWTSHTQKMARIRFQSGADSNVDVAAEVARHTKDLEDRVRVLERIVTDKGFDVAHQIEALRDAREVATQRLADRNAVSREQVQ